MKNTILLLVLIFAALSHVGEAGEWLTAKGKPVNVLLLHRSRATHTQFCHKEIFLFGYIFKIDYFYNIFSVNENGPVEP